MVSSSLSYPHPVPTFRWEQIGLPTYPVSPSPFARTRAYRVTAAVSGCSPFGLTGEAFGEVRAAGCSRLEVGEDMAGPGWPLEGCKGEDAWR